MTHLSVFAFVVAIFGSLLGTVSSASEQVAKEQVRHLRGVRAVGPDGQAIEITSEEDFAKHFGREALEKVKGEVDFSTEKVVWVSWTGSSSTRLGFTVSSCRGQTKVGIHLSTPQTALADNQQHGGLLVMPREATWTFGGEAG